MREQVCIVLNERESTKAKAAEALSSRLRDAGITSSRIPVTNEIESVLKQRLPRIVVVDYLLGDFSTGLDILNGLNTLDADRRPKVIFLTDEPSVQVAVEALREGASHYIELDDAQAIDKVTAEVRELLSAAPAAGPAVPVYPKIDDLVFAAPASLRVRNQIQEAALTRAPIVFLYGKLGSGISTAARALQGLQVSAAYSRSIDLRHTEHCLLELCGLSPVREELRLGSTLSLIVEHIEEEDGAFLAHLAAHRESLWPASGASENSSFLIVCSSDAQTLRAWQSQLSPVVIELPALAERKEDIAPLVQRFVREAEECSGRKLKPFAPEVVTWIATQQWNGDMRQLRSVVIDAAIGASFGEEEVRSAIEARLELWNEQHGQRESISLDPLAAAAALEVAGYRYQAAAARLGCSTRALYALLHPEPLKKDVRA
ncbi:MAG: hypothetical protein J0M12_15810 [Deltaproteobacteria bacterium]|nr:hypothetical protein [Deltaproteobacteria bacterium]